MPKIGNIEIETKLTVGSIIASVSSVGSVAIVLITMVGWAQHRSDDIDELKNAVLKIEQSFESTVTRLEAEQQRIAAQTSQAVHEEAARREQSESERTRQLDRMQNRIDTLIDQSSRKKGSLDLNGAPPG